MTNNILIDKFSAYVIYKQNIVLLGKNPHKLCLTLSALIRAVSKKVAERKRAFSWTITS